MGEPLPASRVTGLYLCSIESGRIKSPLCGLQTVMCQAVSQNRSHERMQRVESLPVSLATVLCHFCLNSLWAGKMSQ